MKHTLLWLDLEMTGLVPARDQILQCAATVTDDALNLLTDGVEYVIHYDERALAHMEPMVRSMHTSSGLLARVTESQLSLQQAEDKLIEFFNQYCEPKKTLLCGNSIWVDRAFLRHHMPRFEALFFYRMIDVSTIKELTLRWYPQLPQFEKQKRHIALSDVHESIAELKYYKEHVFVKK